MKHSDWPVSCSGRGITNSVFCSAVIGVPAWTWPIRGTFRIIAPCMMNSSCVPCGCETAIVEVLEGRDFSVNSMARFLLEGRLM